MGHAWTTGETKKEKNCLRKEKLPPGRKKTVAVSGYIAGSGLDPFALAANGLRHRYDRGLPLLKDRCSLTKRHVHTRGARKLVA